MPLRNDIHGICPIVISHLFLSFLLTLLKKMYETLQGRIVRMVDKDLKLKLTLVQHCQLTLSVTIWMKWDAMVGAPGGPHCWHRHKKRPDWSLSKFTWGRQKSFWEIVLWTDETKIERFGKAHPCTVYRVLKEKKTVKHGGFTDILGLLCCFWHRMPWLVCMAAWNLTTSKEFWSAV